MFGKCFFIHPVKCWEKCVFTSKHYREHLFLNRKTIKRRIVSHYRKSIWTNENKKNKTKFFSQICLLLQNLYSLIWLFKYIVFWYRKKIIIYQQSESVTCVVKVRFLSLHTSFNPLQLFNYLSEFNNENSIILI